MHVRAPLRCFSSLCSAKIRIASGCSLAFWTAKEELLASSIDVHKLSPSASQKAVSEGTCNAPVESTKRPQGKKVERCNFGNSFTHMWMKMG